jgi:hypothetical protein
LIWITGAPLSASLSASWVEQMSPTTTAHRKAGMMAFRPRIKVVVLPEPRGTHHIHDKDLVVGELVPQAIRHHVVGVEHLADHLDFTRPGTVGFNDGAPFIVMQVGTLGVVMKMVLGSV